MTSSKHLVVPEVELEVAAGAANEMMGLSELSSLADWAPNGVSLSILGTRFNQNVV